MMALLSCFAGGEGGFGQDAFQRSPEGFKIWGHTGGLLYGPSALARRSGRFLASGLDVNGVLSGKVDGEMVILSPQQYLQIGSVQEKPVAEQVLFKNGSVLVASVIGVGADEIRVQSRVWETSTIPMSLIQGIVFRPAGTLSERQVEIDRVMQSQSDFTRLIFNNNDFIDGQLEDAVGDETVALTVGGKSTKVALARIQSLVLAQLNQPIDAASRKTSPMIAAGFSDGSRIVGMEMSITADDVSLVVTKDFSLKTKIRYRGGDFWSRLRYFRPAETSFRFLSVSPPFRVQDSLQLPAFATRLNRSVSGGPLMSEHEIHSHGIGTHASSQVVYLLEPSDDVFRCWVCIDRTANRLGDAVCRTVLLDKDNRWKTGSKRFSISANQPPVSLEVDVSGYRAIGLISSSGDHGTTGDRVNWLSARIYSSGK